MSSVLSGEIWKRSRRPVAWAQEPITYWTFTALLSGVSLALLILGIRDWALLP